MLKKVLIITCSTVILLFGLFFGIRYYTKYKIGYTRVCVASHNISQRSQITEDDLEYIELPKDYLKDVYLDLDDIEGKYVKLSYSIPKGSLIYKSVLEDDIKDLAHTLLKENEVNYDLYVNDIKINTANIAKNMYIDLYLTIEKHDKPISDILLSNARITGLYDTNNKVINDYDNDSRVYIVSIAVNKDDVNILNKAQVIGNISCVVNKNTYDTNLKTSINSESELFNFIQ